MPLCMRGDGGNSTVATKVNEFCAHKSTWQGKKLEQLSLDTLG